MGSLYDGALAASAGAAAGAVFAALAANGSLSTVGSALMAGNIGGALTGIGGALSATPLAVVAAPVMFFTALYASMKADETFGRAVGDRAEMFRGLLENLDVMFAP